MVLKKKPTLANDFQYFEFASSLKAAALKITLQRELSQVDHGDSCEDDIAQEAYFHLLNTAILAREAERFQVILQPMPVLFIRVLKVVFFWQMVPRGGA